MPPLQKKVCLLGEFAVGKTSLVYRFVEGSFSDKYLSTIGTKISRKRLAVPAGNNTVDLTMLIWDLAGGEKFSSLMQNYYRGATGAILVCDLTRPETLQALPEYAQNFWSVNRAAPLVVVGNKVDLLNERAVSNDALAEVAARLQAPWYLSSAKTGEHVEAVFEILGRRILEAGEVLPQ